MIAQLCKFTKNQLTVPLKQVNFILCKLYLNKAAVVFCFLKKKWIVEMLATFPNPIRANVRTPSANSYGSVWGLQCLRLIQGEVVWPVELGEKVI